MNKILMAIAVIGIVGTGSAIACESASCQDGGRHLRIDAGSGSVSGTNTFGSAFGSGATVNNQRPAGAFQNSASHAFNETRAGAEADRHGGRELDVEARIESAGHTSSESTGNRFGRDSYGVTSGFARQSGDADAYAAGNVRDNHGDTEARGNARAGLTGWQSSESYTSNVNNGRANSDSSGRFSGTADAEIDVDADHDHAHVTQSGDTVVSAGGESDTSSRRGGYADGYGGGSIEGGTRTRAVTTTGSGPDRTYRVIDSLDDGTRNWEDDNSHDPS